MTADPPDLAAVLAAVLPAPCPATACPVCAAIAEALVNYRAEHDARLTAAQIRGER